MDKPMVLEVVVPVPHAFRVRRKTIVQPGGAPLVTSVRAVRRVMTGGAFDPDEVEVDAFIPPLYRDGIVTAPELWLDEETLRCRARIDRNGKTLAPFLESGAFSMEI